MLKKDAIGWRREFKKNMFEILFPALVVVALIIVRANVKPIR